MNNPIDLTHPFIGLTRHLEDGGTKLYRRTEPPKDDADKYSSNEYGPDSCEFLGYVVIGLGVPRWMSSRFAKVTSEAEQFKPDSDLGLYSEDWMEKILYLRTGEADPQKIPSETKEKANTLIDANAYTQHFLAYGCQHTTPATTIQAVLNDFEDESKFEYYAVVSQVLADLLPPNCTPTRHELAVMTEITIAKIEFRPKFVASALHRRCLKRCVDLRLMNENHNDIHKQRSAGFRSIGKSGFSA